MIERGGEMVALEIGEIEGEEDQDLNQ